jgi:uncharacterized protein
MTRLSRKYTTILLVFASTAVPVHADKFASIIIDDVGNNYDDGYEVISLPATLTVAILPETTYARQLARLANKRNKEVMLHLPMQSVEHFDYAPGRLDLHMTQKEFRQQLRSDLNSVPYIQGVNNHMGSLLTRHPGHMTWLMDELSRRGGLYFIDSKTTNKSVADKIAMENNVPVLSRDFFLDPDHETDTLQQQFDLFIQKINQRGYALAIAHPYPETIKFLKTHLHELGRLGITLIPVSALINTVSQQHTTRENDYVTCTGTACSRL